MIKNRNTAVLSSKYQSDDDMKDFMVKTCGLKLFPVQGKDDSYWISGDKRGNYIDGPKYYKIVFGFVEQVTYKPNRQVKEGYGFDIQSSGDLMGWQMLGDYRTMIHEAVAFVKESKEVLNNSTLEDA